MPTMARSDSTWRTGWSVSAARRSRQAATDCATRRAVPCSWRISLTRRQACSGSRPPRSRRRTASHSSSTHCQPAPGLEVGDQLLVDLQQVLDVAGGVGELVVVERPGQPVGQAVALGQPDAQDALVEARPTTAWTCPTNPAAIWVSNRWAGTGAAGQLEHLEVLVGGVQHGHAVAVEDLGQRGDVDGQRVDQGQPVAPGHLHQGQLREVGALAVELGVDRVGRRVAQGVEHGGEAGVGVDQPVAAHRAVNPRRPVSTGKPASIQARVPPATLTTS